ncbi:MAG TPA: M48 family metallopeptidase [Bryobacteraceae bacterium]|nr:M48 family metallopeptidase [Bryobacteraceae bacterium]
MRQRRLVSVLLLIAGTAIPSAARKPGDPLKPGFNLFSKQQDIQLGQEAAAQVRKQAIIVNDPALQDYIQRVGKRLASQPEAGGYPYTFTVVQDKSINAFALPGGPTFVNTGTIAAADNEAQLAGVMAHEISHVALRHGTNQASKANLLQIPAALAGAIVGNGSLMGQLAQLGIGLGLNSVLLRYSRDAESQADALGSHIMSEAGYNPIEMARFFEKLQGAGGGGRAMQFLSDHPNPGNREQAIEAEIRTLPQRNYGFDTGALSHAKAEVAKLPASPKPGFRTAANGTSTNPADMRPSKKLTAYQGKSFSLSYPDNWQVLGEQNADSVTIAPRAGIVQSADGNAQIGYGVIASFFTPENRDDTLGQATDDLVHHLQVANPNMKVARSGRHVKANGHEALITMLSGSSPFNGVEETDALLTVQRPDALFYLVFIAPASEFKNSENVYNDMVQSVKFR